MEERLSFIAAVIIVVSFGSIVFLTHYLEKRSSENNPKEVKVAYSSESIYGSLLIDMAQDGDFFKKNGLKLVPVSSDKQADTLLISNRVDGLISPSINILTRYLNGEDVIWVGTIFSNFPDSYFVVKKVDKNEKIKFGVAVLGGQSQITGDIVSKNLGWSEVEYVLAGNIATRWAFFERGEIDATLVYPGEGLRRFSKRDDVEISGPLDIYQGFSNPVGFFVTNKGLDEDRDKVKKMSKAILETRQHMLNDKKKTIDFLKNKYGLNDQEANEYFNVISKIGPEKGFAPKKSDIETIVAAVKDANKPKYPNRDLSEYAIQGFLK